jgi:UDP-N-acetylmuramate: L-alanyl-gamma-D-glutamyl-meso-diaminopimelate ligase
MNKVHIIGIAGVLSGALAVELKKQGWEVSGSDKERIYPPVSLLLEKNNIKIFLGYDESNIKKDVDLVIVAGSALLVDKDNPEVVKAKQLSKEVISQAQAIEKFVIKKESLVIAGTYGKTTTTSLCTSILQKSELDPSYMIGGVAIDMEYPSLKISDSEWSVVEGDEYPTLHFDNRPKFLLYHPKYLILTSAMWEHPDVYKSEKEYLDEFIKLVAQIPDDGFILANSEDDNLKNILQGTKHVFWYSLKRNHKSDFWGENITLNQSGISLDVCSSRKRISISSKMMGMHNAENIVAASGAGILLGIDENIISLGITSAPLIRKRMQMIENIDNQVIIHDFSQTKPRIKAAIQSAKDHFPDHKIIVCFYPHYSGWKEKESLNGLSETFEKADAVIITKVSYAKAKDKEVTGSKIKNLIGEKALYLPLDENVPNKIIESLSQKSVVIFMSSGDYRQLDQQVINNLKNK